MGAVTSTSSYPLRAEHAVALALAESEDPDAAPSKLLAAIGQALDWPMGTFWEAPQRWDDTIRCVETWHTVGQALSDFAAATRNTRLTLGEGLPGRVWASGAPAWLPDAASDPNF